MVNEKELEEKKENSNKTELKKAPGVHTYASDMVHVLEHNQGGLARKIIEEEEQKEFDKMNSSPFSKKNRIFLITSIVLILTSIFVIIFVSFNEKQKRAFFPKTLSFSASPIFLDTSEYLDIDNLSKDQVIKLILEKQENVVLRSDGIAGLFLSYGRKLMSLEQFLKLINSEFNLKGLDETHNRIVLGFSKKEKSELFFIIPIKSFENMFFVMKEWEKTLFSDFYSFFNFELNRETSVLMRKDFENKIIQNKNSRVLYDEEGNIVLMYIYADSNNILIIQNEAAAYEILSRMASTKIKR